MKKLMFTLLMLLVAAPAFSWTLTATNVYSKDSTYLTSYRFVGGTYDGYVLYEMHRTCILVSENTVDNTTDWENLGVWCDSDKTYDPFILANQADNPLINERELAWGAGIVVPDPAGSTIGGVEANLIFTAFWFETYVYPKVRDAWLNRLQPSGFNATQNKIGIASMFYSEGLPKTNADAIATAFIDSGTKPVYTDFGMSSPNDHMKTWLRIIDPVGYFE